MIFQPGDLVKFTEQAKRTIPTRANDGNHKVVSITAVVDPNCTICRQPIDGPYHKANHHKFVSLLSSVGHPQHVEIEGVTDLKFSGKWLELVERGATVV